MVLDWCIVNGLCVVDELIFCIECGRFLNLNLFAGLRRARRFKLN